ncbi:hypothetical protein QAD02_004806 [Eretmocerus hayati]|uniref:Uncharacterized protein n=1 Tax=Eretmocerus hayati TaxID=131215 RepID=A0ACC2NR30_9HYME|nr:hypothetical protein QAD02_004806 [Eretmocerus hayati]
MEAAANEVIQGPSSSVRKKYRPRAGSILKKKESGSKNPKHLPGILVERKISQEEIDERSKYIEDLKKSRSNTSLNWKTQAFRKVRLPDKLFGLYCAKFSPNGDTIATTHGSGCIQLRNGETSELRATVRSGLETSLPVTYCCFHPINKEILYASSSCGSLFMCRLDEIQFWKFAYELDNEINTIDVNASGEHVISGGKDATLRIYDSETAKLIKQYRKDKMDLITEDSEKFHHARIFAAKFHKTNSRIIVSGGWDDSIKIWDTRVADGSIRNIVGPHICGDAVDLQDMTILTGSWIVKDSLQLWDLPSGKLIETIDPVNRPANMAGEYLYSVRYFDGDPFKEHVVVGGSGTGNVEIINLKEKQVVANFPANKAVITIDSFRSNIAFGGMDPSITLAEYS